MRTGDKEERRGVSEELRENEGEEHRVSRHFEDRPVHRLVLRVLPRDNTLPDERDATQAHHEGDEAEETQCPRDPSTVD